MQLQTCLSCGAQFPVEGIYCANCGSPAAHAQPVAHLNIQSRQQHPVMRCVSCRILNYAGEVVCKRCGGQLVDRNMADQWQPSRPVHPQPIPSGDSHKKLKEAVWGIRVAWIAGLVSSIVTLIFVLVLSQQAQARGMVVKLQPLFFFEVALSFALTFGIYKKNLICAAAMLGYFCLSKVMQWMTPGMKLNPIAVFVAVCLICCYINGVIGCAKYRKLQAAQTEFAPIG